MKAELASPTAAMLIIHADDVGLCRNVNEATWRALKYGCVTSASIMVPGPAFLEAAEYARRDSSLDWGLHLTLNSEWDACRWGPIAPVDTVPSLVDTDGNFWPDPPSLWKHADTREVEIELRAQIERALRAGIKPSHLDSHMLALFLRQEMLAVLDKVAREYQLPYLRLPGNRLPGDRLSSHPASPKLASLRFPDLDKEKAGGGMFAKLTPGFHQIIVHCGYDDDDLRKMTGEHAPFGSKWRQRDLDAVMSEKTLRELGESNITLTNWREWNAERDGERSASCHE